MSPPAFTDHDMTLLLLVCRLYDAGIVICGIVAIITGHLAGGAGIVAIGAVPLLYTLVASVMHQARRRAETEQDPCSPR